MRFSPAPGLAILILFTSSAAAAVVGCSSSDAASSESAAATDAAPLTLRGQYSAKTANGDVVAMKFLDDTRVAIWSKKKGIEAATYAFNANHSVLTLTDLATKETQKLAFRTGALEASALSTESLDLLDTPLTNNNNVGLVDGGAQLLVQSFTTTNQQGDSAAYDKDKEKEDQEEDQRRIDEMNPPAYCETNWIFGRVCFD